MVWRFIIAFILLADSARAEVVFSVGSSIGRTTASTPSGTEPTLLQYGLNLGAFYNLAGLLVGGVTDYRIVEQYTDVDRNVGNYRGRYWSYLGPMVGYAMEGYRFTADAKLLGKYTLANTTNDGGSIHFKSPLGLRFTALIETFPGLFAGAHYEYLRFSTVEHSMSGDHNLGDPQNLHQLGASAAYFF